MCPLTHQARRRITVRVTTRTPQQRRRWLKVAPTLFGDGAPSASLDRRKAQAALPHPRAPPEHLGGFPWRHPLASDRPKVEDVPLSTSRQHADEAYTAAWERLSAATGLKEVDAMTRRLHSGFERGLHPA